MCDSSSSSAPSTAWWAIHQLHEGDDRGALERSRHQAPSSAPTDPRRTCAFSPIRRSRRATNSGSWPACCRPASVRIASHDDRGAAVGIAACRILHFSRSRRADTRRPIVPGARMHRTTDIGADGRHDVVAAYPSPRHRACHLQPVDPVQRRAARTDDRRRSPTEDHDASTTSPRSSSGSGPPTAAAGARCASCSTGGFPESRTASLISRTSFSPRSCGSTCRCR